MTVIDDSEDAIRDRLGYPVPDELTRFIRTHLERMYVLGRNDTRDRTRNRIEFLERRAARLAEQLAAVEAENRLLLQALYGRGGKQT